MVVGPLVLPVLVNLGVAGDAGFDPGVGAAWPLGGAEGGGGGGAGCRNADALTNPGIFGGAIGAGVAVGDGADGVVGVGGFGGAFATELAMS